MKKLLAYVVLMVAPILFSRCSLSEDLTKIQDAVDSLRIVVGTPEFKNMIHFEFVDAKTKNPVPDVKLKISGAGASKVFSNIGEQESEYTASNGMLDLVLDPHLDSAYLEENPVRFEVTPVISGYLGQTQQVEVSHERIKSVPMSLININDGNTDGVKVSVQTLTPTYDNTNKTTQAIAQQIDGTKTTIEVQPGTILKDASGIPLKGKVKSQVVFFSAADSATQEIIQGSLTGEAQLKDGSTIQTKLISAGMFSAQLTVEGKSVKTLEGEGLKLRTRISADLYNPEKDRTVQEGDTIPMWSKEEGSGKWVLEKYSLVKKDNEGLYLEDVVKHLSYWNWDWFTHKISKSYCNAFPRILWGVSGLTTADVNIVVTLNNVNSQYPIMQESIYQGAYSQFGFFPNNVSGTIKFTERNPKPGTKLVFSPASISFTSLCGTTNKVNVSVASDPNLLTVNLNLSARSSDPNSKIIIRPSTYLYYKPSNQSYWNYMYLYNGVASIKLIPGQDYDVYGCFGKNSGYGKLRIDKVGTDKLQVKLTPTINLTGGSMGSPISLDPIARPANNIVNVNYNAILSPDIFNKLK